MCAVFALDPAELKVAVLDERKASALPLQSSWVALGTNGRMGGVALVSASSKSTRSLADAKHETLTQCLQQDRSVSYHVRDASHVSRLNGSSDLKMVGESEFR